MIENGECFSQIYRNNTMVFSMVIANESSPTDSFLPPAPLIHSLCEHVFSPSLRSEATGSLLYSVDALSEQNLGDENGHLFQTLLQEVWLFFLFF